MFRWVQGLLGRCLKLTTGIVMDDGKIAPTPAVTRVLKETKAALEKAGHKVVEWTPYDVPRGLEIFMRLIRGDGGLAIKSMMTGENRTDGAGVPEPFPVGLAHFDAAAEAARANPPTVSDLWKAQAERQAYLTAFLKHWYASKEVTGTGRAFDAVISPVQPYPAAPRYKFPIREGTYTFVWNLSDQTSLVFPAGTARKTDVKEPREFRNEDEKSAWDNCEWLVGLGGAFEGSCVESTKIGQSSVADGRRPRRSGRHAGRPPGHPPAPRGGEGDQARRRDHGRHRGSQGLGPYCTLRRQRLGD